ncbi:MAG: hypothetical protein HC842_01060 [Cytophagales bacterium]|nr:hypothetical protein [Cytophagales bacterium]
MTGPFNLNFSDVPTPLGFLFGIFPMPRRARSGVIFPKYGEERLRGFFLRDGGYYFDFSDYVNLSVTGELYSKGQYGLNAASQYKKRYGYTGNASFNMSQIPSQNLEDTSIVNSYWFRWSHTPDSKGKSGRFSASVNLGSSSYNQRVSTNYANVINSSFNSTVSYSKNFRNTPFSMGLSGRHQQNTVTNEMDVTLPDMSLTMNRIYPLKDVGKTGKTWYNKVALSYNGTLTNRLTNKVPLSKVPGAVITEQNQDRDSVLAINSANLPVIFDHANNGVRHSIPISTSVPVLKYFTGSAFL